MREILFRGKTKDGEWKEGYFEKSFDTIPCIKYFAGVRYRKYEVIPETVTQYTGYTDSNGKKIFEGDIVRWSPNGENTKPKFDFVVIYGEHEKENIGFYVEWLNNKYLRENVGYWFKKEHIEVIGNIFDNPELLSGIKESGECNMSATNSQE